MFLACSPCPDGFGSLQLFVDLGPDQQAVGSTVYITGEQDSLLAKTDEEAFVNVSLPAGEYEIEAEYLPLSCYSQFPISVLVQSCEVTNDVLTLDRCAYDDPSFR